MTTRVFVTNWLIRVAQIESGGSITDDKEDSVVGY